MAVCTVYDGHYHYGVAALANSLYKNGFKGCVYVGYRGALPFWCKSATKNSDIEWVDCYTYEAAEGFYLHFLPVETNYHLTNYKAEFMLKLMSGPAKNEKALAYFDPDIIVKCRWSFFENWISHGVALVHEVVHNDMPATHPIRLEWENIIGTIGRVPKRTIHSYINAGFCGVARENIDFLEVWAKLINVAVDKFKANPQKFSSFNRTYPFWSIDQDALNIAAMCCIPPISEVGPDGMDFIHGGWIMSHATGSPKPWKKNFLYEAVFKVRPPTLPEKIYWSNAQEPISLFSNNKIRSKKLSLLIASLISRFYSRH